MNKRTKLRLLLIFILIGFIISPAFADETTINLNTDIPYIDIPVEATEPTTITIQTTNGTPQNNPAFIDSWIELWQNTTKLFANDDSAHSATNVLASIITTPIDAGLYFIRATSFAYMCCNQLPTGNYILSWSGVTTIPTATPLPTPTQTPTIEPTPELTQIPIIDNSNNEQILPEIIPNLEPIPMPTEILIPELEIIEEIVEPETIEIPIVEPELSVIEIQQQIQEQINLEYIAENTIELSIPTAFENIPGAEQIFAATEAFLNVGSDMTQEEREESQSVVVAAIVVSQIASMATANVSASTRRRLK